MRLSTDQLTFLARFSKSPDGKQVLDILRAKLADAETGLRTMCGEEIYRQQGRALQIDELIADITKANEKLTRAQPARFAPRQDL